MCPRHSHEITLDRFVFTRSKNDNAEVRAIVDKEHRVLVFRIGSLGDTLAAMPSFWVLRNYFQAAELVLLCDVQPDAKIVVAHDLVAQTGLFDSVIVYHHSTGTIRRAWSCMQLAVCLRRQRFDALAYLAPPDRSPVSAARDRSFFRLCGIRRFIGMDYSFQLPLHLTGKPLPELPHESDLLLDRLKSSGLPTPPPGKARIDLALTEADDARLNTMLAGVQPPQDCSWIAIGPGSKMPVKRWPVEHYQAVVKELMNRYGIWPMIFGGLEDHACAERMIAAWGEGTNATGWPIRTAAAALRRCRLYLGNDTGTMHLAASAGTRCVAIFSARDYPGRWYPYDDGHRVLRKVVPCEGCMLTECAERKMECIRSITEEEVLVACRDLLDASQTASRRPDVL